MLTDAKFRVLVVLWSYVAKLGNDGSSSARGLATSRESGGQESPNELPAALRPGVTVEEESESLGGFKN
jgi:hypothetical protein